MFCFHLFSCCYFVVVVCFVFPKRNVKAETSVLKVFAFSSRWMFFIHYLQMPWIRHNWVWTITFFFPNRTKLSSISQMFLWLLFLTLFYICSSFYSLHASTFKAFKNECLKSPCFLQGEKEPCSLTKDYPRKTFIRKTNS